MENAPAIIIFWWLVIASIILMSAFIIAAVLFTKKGNAQDAKFLWVLGKTCLILSMLCAVPVFFVVGYILYLYIA